MGVLLLRLVQKGFDIYQNHDSQQVDVSTKQATSTTQTGSASSCRSFRRGFSGRSPGIWPRGRENRKLALLPAFAAGEFPLGNPTLTMISVWLGV
jgi:hypothetical protein